MPRLNGGELGQLRNGEFAHATSRDALCIIFRRKRAILIFFAIVMTAAIVYTLLETEIYRSEAKLLIRLGRESLSVDPSISEPRLSVSRSHENEINSELAILRSRYLAEMVVEGLASAELQMHPDEAPADSDVNLSSVLSPRDISVDRIMSGLTVEVEPKSNIVSITYKADNGRVAQEILASLVHFYLERHIEIYATQASPQFFENRAELQSAEFVRLDRQLDEFRRQHGIASFESQKGFLLQQISALETQLNETRAEVEAGRASVAALLDALRDRQQTVELSRITGRTNTTAEGLRQRLLELQLSETSMSSRYSDSYRPLAEVRAQIRIVAEALQGETSTEVILGLDTNYRAQQLSLVTATTQLKADEARLAVLTHGMEEQRQGLADFAGLQREHERLTRERDLAEIEYKRYRDNLQRAKGSAALDIDKISNVSVVQPATLPMKPIHPRKTVILLLGVLLAVTGASVLALLLERLDDTLKTDDDVKERLELPVLASISEREYEACT